MKALWIESAGVVHFGELPDPVPQPGWVKLKILASSVCGSDLGVYRFGRSYPVEKRVSGHEFVGVIEETGNRDSKWKTGQRVCVLPQIYCHACGDCEEGHYNTCANRKYIGGRDYNGGFAEYAVVPEECLLAVPDSISDIAAAMTEPFAVSLHAVHQAGGTLLKGKSLAIYGAGPIGLFAMEAAKYYGVREIILLDLVPERLEIAKAHGATETIFANVSQEEIVKRVFERTGGRGVDAVIDAVCIDPTIDNDLHFCKPHGKIVIVSIPKKKCTLDFLYAVRNEIDVVGSYTYTTEMEDCLKILGSGTVSVEYIADPVVPLSRGAETFKLLSEKPNECLKAVFIP